MTVLRSGSASDVGRVRSVNEDRLLESGWLYAVADGMGGHAGGEVAAATAIGVLERAFGADQTAAGLVHAVRQANRAVWERSHQDADVRGMGTTLIAAALVPGDGGDRLVVANVGDSRAYRFSGGQVEQMTTDHSVAEELVARGELSEEEAAVHPHRHILTRALGVAPEVDIDTWELVPAEGDRYLLCSDGLTNEVSEDRIAEVLATVRDPAEVARRLVAMANDHGGNDNVTVVVLDVVVADAVDGASGRSTGRRRATPAGVGAGVGASVGRAVGGETGDGAPGAGDGPDRPSAGPATSRGTRRPTTSGRRGDRAGAAGGSPADGPAEVIDLPTVSVSSRPRTLERPRALDGDETAEPPEMLARHVTAALSEVMGRRRALQGAPGGGVERRRTRRLTARVALFVVLVLVVLAGAGAVVHYYAEDAWFVRLDGTHVAVYQGRPGGFLGFEPKVVEVSDLTQGDVLAFRVAELRAGVPESSRQAADRFIANLHAEYCAAQPQAATCHSGTAGTTAPGGPAGPGGVVLTASTAARAQGGAP